MENKTAKKFAPFHDEDHRFGKRSSLHFETGHDRVAYNIFKLMLAGFAIGFVAGIGFSVFVYSLLTVAR